MKIYVLRFDHATFQGYNSVLIFEQFGPIKKYFYWINLNHNEVYVDYVSSSFSGDYVLNAYHYSAELFSYWYTGAISSCGIFPCWIVSISEYLYYEQLSVLSNWNAWDSTNVEHLKFYFKSMWR